MSAPTTHGQARTVLVPQQRGGSPRRVLPPPVETRPSGLGRLPRLAVALDAVLVLATVLLAGLGRHSWGLFPDDGGDLTRMLAVLAPALTLAGVASIAALGGYQRGVFGAGTDEYRRVLNGWFLTAALLGIGCYLARYPLARGFFVLLLGVGPVLLVGGRLVLRRVLYQLRRRGRMCHRVLIVGAEQQVDEVAEVLRRETWLGYDVVGALTPHAMSTATRHGVPVIGRAADVVTKTAETGVDTVFVAGGAVSSAAELREIAWDLESSRAQLVVAPGVTDVAAERVSVRPVGGLPLIHLGKPRSADAVRRAKRSFDAIGSFLLILAFSPVFVFAAWKIWRHDGGPVFFRQTRVGRDGESFQVWKFRTMVTDAEQLLARLHAQQGFQSGLFKMEDDPRVTAPGRWLRRFSIDELPQLFNVLVGDMSLVGPRPPLPSEVAQYDEVMARRLRVRPGMTGLWQVSGRSDLSWSEAIRLDLYYVDNWSMVQDLTILGRTLGAVLASRGAY